MTEMLAHAVVLATGCALGVAVCLAIVRIVRGPSAVDRAVANEVVVSTLVCALGVEAAINRHAMTLPVLVSLSLIGFLASVAVARYAVRDTRDGGGLQVGHEGSPGEATDDIDAGGGRTHQPEGESR